jgi:putative SOS response-associated peptidase YedK
MCGRFSQTQAPAKLQLRFKVPAFEAKPRWNLAPTQDATVIVEREGRRAENFRWGLIPAWAKDPKIGHRMINARAETVAEKPAFKRPFRFWDRWNGPDGKALHTFTILTTSAGEDLKGIHDRMPVVLEPEGEERWLDPKSPPEGLLELLRPAPKGRLAAYEVSRAVNNPRNDVPECIRPLKTR